MNKNHLSMANANGRRSRQRASAQRLVLEGSVNQRVSEVVIGNDTQSIGTSLRSEIVQSQQIYIDLLKWKVILTAALGGAGLGVNFSKQPIPVVFALIPLVSVYVDVACSHVYRRILVIANWFKMWPERAERIGKVTPAESFICGYEHWCDEAWSRSNRPSSAESVAIRAFTELSSFLLLLIGLALWFGGSIKEIKVHIDRSRPAAFAIILTSTLAIMAVEWNIKREKAFVDNLRRAAGVWNPLPGSFCNQ